MMSKIVFLADFIPGEYFMYDDEMQEIFGRLGPDVNIVYHQDSAMSEMENPMTYIGRAENEGVEWIVPSQETLDLLADADAVLLQWAPFNRKMIDAAKNLKFIGSMRSGFENIDVAYAEQKGITVRNCPGRLASSVADLTVAMILSENKGLLRINLRSTDGKWLSDMSDSPSRRPLCMLKAGLVGFGIIAREVAKRLQGFSTEVMAYDPFCADEEFEKMGVQRVDLDTLLTKSDIISVHARLSDETRGLIGEKEIAKIKPSAIFINSARAGLVDEKALVKAMEEKRLAGIGLDVYESEPIEEDFPLLKMDNATLMPHCGGAFSSVMQFSLSLIVETLRQFLNAK